jgi:hypothetical protein
LQGRARPTGQALTGELGLIVAFLRQVLEDTQSPNADHRNAALWFLQDTEAVMFWTSLGGIDSTAFLEHAQRACGQG